MDIKQFIRKRYRNSVPAMFLIFLFLVCGSLCACSADSPIGEKAQSEIKESETVENGKKKDKEDKDMESSDTIYVNVRLEGGTGKAKVTSPCKLKKVDNTYHAIIEWSSSHYDYMLLGEEKYLPINTEGNSTFEIPVEKFEEAIPVIADTTAMGTPHEIEYSLTFDPPEKAVPGPDENSSDQNGQGGTPSGSNSQGTPSGDNSQGNPSGANSQGNSSGTNAQGGSGNSSTNGGKLAEILKNRNTNISKELQNPKNVSLEYATQFTLDTYDGGYTLISIADGSTFLTIPAGGKIPADLPKEIQTIKLPLKQVYLVASAVMDMYASIDAVDELGFTGTKEQDWYIDAAKKAMQAGTLKYAGKYSAPDYEMLLAKKCDLAIENTMISHSPKVKEQLEKFGIPVLIDHSSYESEPLGRMEWVKLYGLLAGKSEKALSVFEEQKSKFAKYGQAAGSATANAGSNSASGKPGSAPATGNAGSASTTGNSDQPKTVAFFYITSDHQANVRKGNDYLAKMINLAGGSYIFSDLGVDDASSNSTMSMTMEEFYARAKDADYVIYNSTIEGELKDLASFTRENDMLKNFKAVREGHVYCTTKNLYQSSMQLGSILEDIYHILHEPDAGLTYLYPLK